MLYRCITDLNLQLNTEILFIVISIQFIVYDVFRNSWFILEDSILRSLLKINFVVTPCINDIHHFIVQLMDTTLKKVELLKHFKIKEAAPTCFGLQGNRHQGATASN